MSISVRHAAAVWRRNAAMYARTWKWKILPNFFEPVFYLAAVGIGVGSYIQEMGGVSYAQFLAPGLVCVAAMNGASFEVTYNAFVRLNFEKTYESVLTTPIQPEDVLAGEILWAVTRPTIYGGAFLIVITAWGLVDPLHALGEGGGAPPRGVDPRVRRPQARRPQTARGAPPAPCRGTRRSVPAIPHQDRRGGGAPSTGVGLRAWRPERRGEGGTPAGTRPSGWRPHRGAAARDGGARVPEPRRTGPPAHQRPRGGAP